MPNNTHTNAALLTKLKALRDECKVKADEHRDMAAERARTIDNRKRLNLIAYTNRDMEGKLTALIEEAEHDAKG